MPFQNLGINFMLQRDSSYGKLLIKFTLKNGEILSLKPIADGGYLMYKTKKYALMTTVLISASLLYFGLNEEKGGNIEYPDFETYGQTVYLPTYIPEGYTVQDVNITGKMIVSMFTCKSDYILFTCLIQTSRKPASVSAREARYSLPMAAPSSSFLPQI